MPFPPDLGNDFQIVSEKGRQIKEELSGGANGAVSERERLSSGPRWPRSLTPAPPQL